MRLATPACLAQMPASKAAMLARYREARRNLWAGTPEPPEPKRPPAHVDWPVPVRLAPAPAAESLPEAPPPRPRSPLAIQAIARHVAHADGVPYADIMSPTRTARIVWPRQKAMWLAKRLTLKSMPEIGRRFGGRDHTTVLHALRKVERLRADDPALASELEQLESELRPQPEEETHGEGEER